MNDPPRPPPSLKYSPGFEYLRIWIIAVQITSTLVTSCHHVRKVAELGSNTLNDLTSRSVHNLGTLTATQTHSTFI